MVTCLVERAYSSHVQTDAGGHVMVRRRRGRHRKTRHGFVECIVRYLEQLPYVKRVVVGIVHGDSQGQEKYVETLGTIHNQVAFIVHYPSGAQSIFLSNKSGATLSAVEECAIHTLRAHHIDVH